MDTPQTAAIAYGKNAITLRLDNPDAEFTLIEPAFQKALEDPEEVFKAKAEQPEGSDQLRNLAGPEDTVIIVTADGTRPVPNKQLIPWILDSLACPDQNITVLLGNGTHRENTSAEIEEMFGPDICKRIRIINHRAANTEEQIETGSFPDGTPVKLNREYVQADKRIAVGFIEPHFFAGFSGGAKAIIPGIASEETIHHIHRYELIADPQSTWGMTDGNPVRTALEAGTATCPPDFMVNVILNRDKEITAIHCGDYIKAHRAGCETVRNEAMTAVDDLFPIVITSNSGYPLDQNLYQTVKGISAAARITEPGGIILVASECSDGIPDGIHFAEIMQQGNSADEILAWIAHQTQVVPDQWQGQTLAGIIADKKVKVFSSMPDKALRLCKLEPIQDLQAELDRVISSRGPHTKVAIMPDGPLTIPYVNSL